MSDIGCQMWDNDRIGNCVPAYQLNATIVWNWARGVIPAFNVPQSAITLYEEEAHYNPADPSTDQGTDMEAAAVYWKANGIQGSDGQVHKIDDYLWIDKSDVDMIIIASYLFEFPACGAAIGDAQEKQFLAHEPWSGDPIGDPGRHCFGIKGQRNGMLLATTWARWEQEVDDSFLADHGLGSIVPFSRDMLDTTKSLEGFDYQQLSDDLAVLRQEAA